MKNTIKSSSFLRWAGSKKNMINEIGFFLPETYSCYHEPFLGSGAVFFNLINNKDNCHLTDSNERLINTYIQIKENVEDVIEILRSYCNNESFYYQIRNNSVDNLKEEAAQFIYLNRTCFNGLYRVNSKNNFNVPYGKRHNVDFVTENLLRAASESLKNAILNACDFEETLANIETDDLVFIDPPYVISHNENGFIEYNQKIFTWADQIRLKEYIIKVIDKGAYFILTNAAHESIRELYSEIGNPYELERLSKIGGKNAYRGNVKEYIFSNTR